MKSMKAAVCTQLLSLKCLDYNNFLIYKQHGKLKQTLILVSVLAYFYLTLSSKKFCRVNINCLVISMSLINESDLITLILEV